LFWPFSTDLRQQVALSDPETYSFYLHYDTGKTAKAPIDGSSDSSPSSPRNIAQNRDGLSEAFTEPTLPDTEDGYGWIVTISVALINGHSWGISSIYSVFLAHFLANNTFPGITKLQYTLVRSLTVGYTLLISPLIIIAVRKFRTRPTMLVGTVSESVGLVYTSLLIQIWHFFLLQGILFGIGIEMLFLLLYSIISQ
jgi:hypothetical protein